MIKNKIKDKMKKVRNVQEEIRRRLPSSIFKFDQDQKNTYLALGKNTTNAKTREETLKFSYELLDFAISLDTCWLINIFIPNFLPMDLDLEDLNIRRAIIEITDEIKKKYEDQGFLVYYDNGMGDFRDFYFSIVKK